MIGWQILFGGWVGSLLLTASAMSAEPPAPACEPASSAALTGAAIDAPFFVFDGGSRGPGLGQFDQPSAIEYLGAGVLAIADSANDRVKIVTSRGFFQDFLGGSGAEPGRLREPSGLVGDGQGAVWVVDRGNHRLQRLTLFQSVDELPGTARDELGWSAKSQRPQHAAIDGQGRIYVTDPAARLIHRVAADGTRLPAWGAESGRDWQQPHGVAIDADGRIYVTDRGAGRVFRLTADGTVDLVWGQPGAGDGDLAEPEGLALDPDGFVYVADSGNHRIQKFDAEGRFVAQVGCAGDDVGQFRDPSDVAIDGQRHLYVVDRGNHRIQKLGHQ